MTSLKLKEGHLLFERLVVKNTAHNLKAAFLKWNAFIKQKNSKLMECDKVNILSLSVSLCLFFSLFRTHSLFHTQTLSPSLLTLTLSLSLTHTHTHTLTRHPPPPPPHTHTQSHTLSLSLSHPLSPCQSRWRLHAISNQEVDLQAWYHSVFFDEIYRYASQRTFLRNILQECS